jgi:hypothetical protein
MFWWKKNPRGSKISWHCPFKYKNPEISTAILSAVVLIQSLIFIGATVFTFRAHGLCLMTNFSRDTVCLSNKIRIKKSVCSILFNIAFRWKSNCQSSRFWLGSGHCRQWILSTSGLCILIIVVWCRSICCVYYLKYLHRLIISLHKLLVPVLLRIYT